MTFSIIAATAHGNRGAQAMLETVIGRLREERRGLRFHVFSYYPRADRGLLRDPSITLHSSTPLALVLWLFPWSVVFGLLRLLFGRRALRVAPAAIRALADSAALVDLAGVSFVGGRSKFLPFNVLTLVPAMLVGTPVVKMPQAMGPFGARLDRWAARLVLPRCRMVWARGGRTVEYLRDASFPGLRFAQADDIAFNHRDVYALTRENEERVEAFIDEVRAARATARGVVGLCPSSVVAVQAARSGGEYEPILAGLIRGLAEEGFQVVLFPNATRAADPVGQRNNDLPLMRRLAAAAGGASPAPLVADMDISASGIKRVIAATDVVLVSRFHAMVGALSLGVPVAVLGWSHKYAEVMARFGLEANVMDYRQLDGGRLRASVRGVFDAREAIRAAIASALPAVKASAARPVLALLSPSLGADLA